MGYEYIGPEPDSLPKKEVQSHPESATFLVPRV